MSRTNIEIDEGLVRSVMAMYHLPTKRAAVDFALRQVAVRPMTKAEMLAMEGAGWDGDLDELRDGTEPSEPSQPVGVVAPVER
ncbi:MAG: type II toxin-antitoxin system VapB family antitoxin [Kineosporiaceae bacterium]